MRITKTMMLSNMFTNINKIQSKLLKHQIQIASNRRILAPSDDPIGTSHALIARTALAKNEQYQRNVTNANNSLTCTENALNQIHELLADVKVLTSKGITDTTGSEERHGIANVVSQHLESLVQYAKTKFNGKYIFGGQQTLSAPFSTGSEIEDENFSAQFDTPVELNHVHFQNGSANVTNADGSVTYAENTDYTINVDDGTITVLSTGSMVDGENYLIDYKTESLSRITTNPDGISGKIKHQIGEDVTMEINVPGDEVFCDEVNMFDLLIELRNKMERDDVEGAKNLMDDIQTAIDHVGGINGEVGAKINRLSFTTEFLENENLNLKDYKSSEEELNLTEAYIKFQSLETSYQATLSTSAKIMNSNLMNFINF